MSINAQECLLADSSLFITNFWLCYSGIIHSKPLEDQVTKSGTLAGNMQQLLTYKALRQPQPLPSFSGWRREGGYFSSGC